MTALDRLTEPAVVRLPAEIDMSNASGVGDELRSAISTGVTVVVADMTSTGFCDSAGMRCLLLADDHAGAHGAQLRVALPPGQVLRILQLMGIDRLLTIYPSLAAAVSGGSPGQTACTPAAERRT